MSGFTSPETGDFDKYFMTTTELIDRFVIGNLWVWGLNNSAQLGDNSLVSRSSPVQTIAKGSTWTQVNNAAAIKTDGTLWLWSIYVGDNKNITRSSPVQTICGGTNWKFVSNRLAIKTDGTLWVWGGNNYGQLGINSIIVKSSPVQTICGGNNWKSVSSWVHSVAIKTDGTLWVWGYNPNGQLGDNTTVNKSSPVQTICGGTNWKHISAGFDFTVAIKTDGTLWTWGRNADGQLGDNTIIDRSSPIQTICGGTNWKSCSNGTGQYHTLAIKTDGTLWVWGNNYNGQLGINTNGPSTQRSSPVQTICGGTN